MRLKKFVVQVLIAGGIPVCCVYAAQNYPDKPIRILVAGVGGSGDLATRLIAQGLTTNLGQSVIVDNRPNGVILGNIVSKANPDGYTLLYAGASFWLQPFMQSDLEWDPIKDFLPVTLAVSAPNVLVVGPTVNAKTVDELIALAKAKPGELNYASGGLGSSNHLAAELFKVMASINVVHVPYNSTGAALTALMTNQVQLMFPGAGPAAPYIKAGRLVAVAVTGLQPSPLFPGLPTVASSVPGYESVSMAGLFVPAKTPFFLVDRLNQEIVRVLENPTVKERFLRAGVETVGSSPERFAAQVKAEMQRLGKLIKESGIHAN